MDRYGALAITGVAGRPLAEHRLQGLFRFEISAGLHVSLVVELLVASRNGTQDPDAIHTRNDDF
jgi:hypothetical protein